MNLSIYTQLHCIKKKITICFQQKQNSIYMQQVMLIINQDWPFVITLHKNVLLHLS